jgi:hypothetical protein
MYATFPYISARGCFQDLEPMTPWSQGNSFTAALGLPFISLAVYLFLKKKYIHTINKTEIG